MKHEKEDVKGRALKVPGLITDLKMEERPITIKDMKENVNFSKTA